jgi:20S proteasome subunit beta 4
MEFLIGVVGKDFVLVGTDVLTVRSIVVMSRDKKKVHTIGAGGRQVLCASGESGEVDRLRERLQAEAMLAQYRLHRDWRVEETAYFTRNLIADHLRTRTPFQCDLLIAGVDVLEAEHQDMTDDVRKKQRAEPALFWLDHLGSVQRLPYAAHGYGGYLTWGLLDAAYKPGMTREEAVALLGRVTQELQTRFIMQLPKLALSIIDADGVHSIDTDGLSL